MPWIMQLRGVEKTLQQINMHQTWAWSRETDRKPVGWIINPTFIYTLFVFELNDLSADLRSAWLQAPQKWITSTDS